MGDIINIGKSCLHLAVKEAIIPLILPKNNIALTRLIRQENNSLREQCVLNKFSFISNDNISRTHLWKDGIYLEDLDNSLSWFCTSNWNSRNVKDYDKNSSDSRLVLETLKLKNNHRLVIGGNLDINSISNKFDNLKLITQGKIDILILTGTKTDSIHKIPQYSRGY